MLFSRLLLPLCLLPTLSSAADLSANLTFTSDYRVNAISQTSGNPVLQGGVDVMFQNGLYSGVWASQVDWGDDADTELDYYVGHTGALTDNLFYSATLYYVTYPGYHSYDLDYSELRTALYFRGFTFHWYFSNDYINTSESHRYLAVDYNHLLSQSISLQLHAGRTEGSYWTTYDIGEHSDFSVGLKFQRNKTDLVIKYLKTEVDSVYQRSKGPLQNDDSLLFEVSHNFQL